MIEPPLLHIEDLFVRFPSPRGPVEVVRGFSLTMGREKIGIVGESGSGKSMTARALMGLVRAPGQIDAKRLELGGTDLLRLSAGDYRALRGKRLSMILQDPKFSLNPVQRIGRQIEETILLHEKADAAARRERALAMLEAVGIDDPARVYRAYPHELSGGMAQRAMIAAMLVGRPQLLIADEPTSALDVLVRDQVLELINVLSDKVGFGLLLISHDLNMVARFCDRILVMYRGQVVETLAAAALHEAQHPYTRGLIACLPSARTRGHALPVLARDAAWERPHV